jgi:alpha-tubulin suppressor-like RCC1 family protein
VLCWGANDYGQLGIGSTEPTVAPERSREVSLGEGVRAAELDARGHHHVCVRTIEGRIKCW